jgi:hypothetical protein
LVALNVHEIKTIGTDFDSSFKNVVTGRGKPKPRFGYNERKKEVDRVLLVCRSQSSNVRLYEVLR